MTCKDLGAVYDKSANGLARAGVIATATQIFEPTTEDRRPTTNFLANDRRPTTDDVFYNISSTHDLPSEASHHSGTHPGTRLDAGGVRQNRATARRAHTYPHRTRHLQRDVERALLLQVFACAFEAVAHSQQTRGPGTGREHEHH